MIVVVALLLGFSLNMFQFRNPFRSMETDTSINTNVADKARFPSRQETTLPVSPVAKPPQPEAAPVKEGKAAQPKAAEEAEPKKDAAVTPVPVPADVPAPAPQAVADTAPEKQGAPVSITVEHESPSLAAPKVTSDPAKAKAGKIGRQVATGVAESKPEPKTVAEASAPAPAPAVQENKAENAASAGNNEQKESGKAAPQEQAKPEPAATAEKAGTPNPSQQSASSAAEPAKSALAPAPAETGMSSAQSVQAAQSAANAQGDQPAAKTPQALATSTASSGTATPPGQTKAEEKPAAPKGTRILEIKTQDKPGEFVLTIVTDGPVEKVTSFHAKGPARLAVDLQGSWQSALGASIPVEGELFERLRLGAHPDKLRLVIDYRDKDLAAFSEQIVEKQPKGVVVRIPKAKPKP